MIVRRGCELSSEFVSRLRANEPSAWEEFYDSTAGDLRAFVARLGSRNPDDTLGEVMVQVVRDIGRFRGADSELRPWTFGIARNRVIDEGRRRSRRPQEVESDPSADFPAPMEESLDLGTVSALLDQLTVEQREVVWLRHGVGFSLVETAEIVGKDPEAVAALSYRGLRRLRRLLSGS